ncbi:MAG: nucleotide sugar dehydrogenase, partial [Acidobacteriota bacterium]
EGSAVRDFSDPPKIVVGERTPGAGAPVFALYEGIHAPRFATSIETAELVKYADNSFHALKVVFANEVGAIARGYGIDGREVMDVFCADTKLNLSQAYLRPGFAFGGSCLPKDLRALQRAAADRKVAVPMLDALSASNERQIDRALELVRGVGEKEVGLVGLAFKPGTDDLRESALVTLSEKLMEEGFHLRIHDPSVCESRLVGSNRAFVDRHLGVLSDLLVDSLDELDPCRVVVLGHPTDEATVERWLGDGKHVIDLVGTVPGPESPNYLGISW